MKEDGKRKERLQKGIHFIELVGGLLDWNKS
jgi:hypothetical protein